MAQVESFAALSDPGARLLILGSMPGTASLEASQYYAHRRNAFWPIIEAVYGIERDLPYAQRCRLLLEQGVAVWDVLARCERPGSLDASIDRDSILVNDFVGFFAAHRHIGRICFNGATADQLFRRHALPLLPSPVAELELLRLPSTSPAHAALTLAQKTARWRAALFDD